MSLDVQAAASPLPEAETLRRVAEEVISRPDYNLEAQPGSGRVLLDLILDFISWLLSPFRALFDALSAISPVLDWAVIILVFLVVFALIAHIIYSIKMALQGRRPSLPFGAGTRKELVDPTVLEQMADEAFGNGDYIGAIRHLFRACLLRLEQVEKRTFRRGMTNREHLRRYRSGPISQPLELFVETIDTKWYGQGVCLPEDYERCRSAHQNIRHLARETSNAHRA